MNCQHCGASVLWTNSFCEDCGMPIRNTKDSTDGAPRTNRKSTKQAASPEGEIASFELMTWMPWRWLFQKNYGSLVIADDHLIFDISPSWQFKFFEVITWIFFFGFNPLGFYRNNGSAQLKNVATVSLLKQNWLVWRFNILFVFCSGVTFLFLPIPKSHMTNVEAFASELRNASRRAKYAVAEVSAR